MYRQIIQIGVAGAEILQRGTHIHQVVPDQARQQSANDVNLAEEEVPVDITYPTSHRRREVSCIVYTCPQKYFINIMGANCCSDIH